MNSKFIKITLCTLMLFYTPLHQATSEKLPKIIASVGGIATISLLTFYAQAKIIKSFHLCKPTETFESINLRSDIRKSFQGFANYLKNPEKYAKIGAKIPNGILLSQGSTQQKISIIKALAGEAECNLITVNAADFKDTHTLILGKQRIKELFKKAQPHTPCLIFIENIQALIGKYNREYARSMQQLFTCMSNINQASNPVIIIGSIQSTANLHPAALSFDRFDCIIEIPPLDQKERFEILQTKFKKIQTNDQATDKITAQLERIALLTKKFTHEQLQDLIQEASWIATEENADEISDAHLAKACDNILLGKPNFTTKLTDLEKRMTAYHEAGHALLRLFSKHQSNALYGVSIIPRTQSLGITYGSAPEHKVNYNKQEYLDQIAIKVAGRAAEELISQEIGTGAYSDFKAATNLAYDMVCTYGMTDNLGNRVYFNPEHLSESMRAKIDQEINNILKERYEFVMQTLKNNKQLLVKLAEELIKQETLYTDQICELLNIHPANESQLKAAMIV